MTLSLSLFFNLFHSHPRKLAGNTQAEGRGCSDRKVGLVRPAKGDSAQPTVLALRALASPEARFVSRLILYFTIAVAPAKGNEYVNGGRARHAKDSPTSLPSANFRLCHRFPRHVFISGESDSSRMLHCVMIKNIRSWPLRI